jgi:hypothetical protein
LEHHEESEIGQELRQPFALPNENFGTGHVFRSVERLRAVGHVGPRDLGQRPRQDRRHRRRQALLEIGKQVEEVIL